MRVTRLEIFGFKSFMDRLVLPLEAGITGVVGPNGCGKSNIVDALRWVLGETNARSLRGAQLEDVIFSGTDKLRPLGLAEVTLTLQASSENFFSDLTSSDYEAEMIAELTEAESAVKKATAVAEATAEPEALEQSGEGESTDEEQAEERPKFQVIDGNKDKKEKEEIEVLPDENPREIPAPKKSPVSASLLQRFSWLQATNEVQVTRRLYRSGESEFFINRVPCRLKDIKELFRAVGISARAYTIVAQGQVSRIVSAKPTERRLIIEEAAGVLGFRDKIAASERRLSDTTVNISRIEDIYNEISRQVRSLSRQAAKARNREALKAEVAEAERKLYTDRLAELELLKNTSESKRDQLVEAEQAIEAKLEKERAREEQARSELMSVDVEGDDLRRKIDAIREEINNRARKRNEKTSRMSELRAFTLAAETETNRVVERKKTLMERSGECETSAREYAVREQELSEQITKLSEEGKDELKSIELRLQEEKGKLREQSAELRTKREELVRILGKLEALEKQLTAASPISKLKESRDGALARVLGDVASDAKIFIEGLNITEEYVKPLQAVLAEKAAFLVTDKPAELARAFSEYQRNSGKGEEQGLGLLKSGGLPSSQPFAGRANVPSTFVRILDSIEVEENFRYAAEKLLGSTYLVPSLDEAYSYLASLPEETFEPDTDTIFVTPQGEIVTSYSYYSLNHEGGVVQMKNQVQQYQSQSEELKEIVATLEAGVEAKEATVSEMESARQEAQRLKDEREAQLRKLNNEIGQVRGQLASEKRAAEQVQRDLEKATVQLDEVQKKIAGYESDRQKLQLELDSLVSDEEEKLHAEVRELNEKYLALDDIRSKNRSELGALAEIVDGVRKELDMVRGEMSEMQLSAQKVEIETEHIFEKIREDYSENLLYELQEQAATNGKPVLSDEERTELKESIMKIKNRIAREGEVDPDSIARYEEEKTRLEELEVQKVDLESAASTLRKTIERLRITSQERFIQTYEAVRENFAVLIPRLFGGGQGSLDLTDDANPLDAGVLITVRPPGKKPKSIDLLSGGEKALCATSLIMAMFLVRPSPLCVLDEVDAPLDEANLVRFLSVVKEMSEKTQFLMITHNKGSMSAADKLVGVTMQQPGASTILTVSLQEAYSQVA